MNAHLVRFAKAGSSAIIASIIDLIVYLLNIAYLLKKKA